MQASLGCACSAYRYAPLLICLFFNACCLASPSSARPCKMAHWWHVGHVPPSTGGWARDAPELARAVARVRLGQRCTRPWNSSAVGGCCRSIRSCGLPWVGREATAPTWRQAAAELGASSRPWRHATRNSQRCSTSGAWQRGSSGAWRPTLGQRRRGSAGPRLTVADLPLVRLHRDLPTQGAPRKVGWAPHRHLGGAQPLFQLPPAAAPA